jgi:hypothetical protein
MGRLVVLLVAVLAAACSGKDESPVVIESQAGCTSVVQTPPDCVFSVTVGGVDLTRAVCDDRAKHTDERSLPVAFDADSRRSGRRRVDEVAGVVAQFGPDDARPAVAERGVATT